MSFLIRNLKPSSVVVQPDLCGRGPADSFILQKGSNARTK